MDKKARTIYMLSIRDFISDWKTHADWQWRDGKTFTVQTEGKNKTGKAQFLSDKTDYAIKTKKKDKGHYIMIKRTTWQKDVTIVYIYAPNMGTPTYMKLL